MIARNTTTKRPAAIMTKWLATVMLISACATTVRAQNAVGPLYSPYGAAGTDTDAEWFAPVDFDFENRPMRKDSGYFFRFDKMNWATQGESYTIGDPDVVVMSEIIYRVADFAFGDVGNPVPQYAIENGLQNIAPDAVFGWGNRYEFGLQENGNGWQIGILDGPQMSQSITYGTGPQASGFGSIHINFVTPQDYLRGFRDYFSNGDDTPGTVVNGPGGVGGSVVIGGTGTGTGTGDDLNGNLNEAVNVLTIDGDPVAIITDFNDSTLFNLRFNQLTVRNTTESRGVELMRTVQLTNRHQMQKHQGRRAEIGYGVRFLSLNDEFGFNGTSDLFTGLNRVSMIAANQIVGPQVRGRWSVQRGRWNLAADGRFVFGYNVQDLDQSGTWGGGLVTGALNAPEVAQPTTFASSRQEEYFSPMVEVRLDASYQLTNAVALRLGYTGMFIDNISRASQLVEYRLPDWGIGQAGQQDISINGVNFGFDINY